MDQKLAVVSLFFLVADADARLNYEESVHIEKVMWTLGISLSEWFENRPDQEEIYPVLKTLIPLQKEWLILTIKAIIDCDSEMNQQEKNISTAAFEGIGVSAQEVKTTIAKSKTIANYLIYG